MIALLARCFKKIITVISKDYARTYLADGTEDDGVVEGAIWIAHHSEFHYYGVLRAKDSFGRTGGFSGDCPLCTMAWECGTCAHQRSLAKKQPRATNPGAPALQSLGGQSSKSSSLPELKRRRIRQKGQCPITEPPSCQAPANQLLEPPPKALKSVNSKKDAPGINNKFCGNCGRKGYRKGS